MSFADDTCDWCRAYCDPIGCDTAVAQKNALWCGQCPDGLQARYSRLDDDQLKMYAAKVSVRITQLQDELKWTRREETRRQHG